MVVASSVATAAVALAFIAIALGVLMLAFSGGSGRGARKSGSAGRSSRRAALLAVAAVSLLFGIAVPAISLGVNSDDQSKSAPGGVDLSASQQEGRRVFAQNCGTCHTLKASNSVGKVGPNLDVMRPPKELTLDAIAKGRARGMGQMPSQLIDGEEAENVAEFIVAVAGR